MYPKMLPWQARKAGIHSSAAERLWNEALRDATNECAVIESSDYWKSSVDHLLDRIATESQVRRTAPFGWGSLLRLPARLWLHELATIAAMFSIGVTTARVFQHRSNFLVLRFGLIKKPVDA
jgi:hypothetical protein